MLALPTQLPPATGPRPAPGAMVAALPAPPLGSASAVPDAAILTRAVQPATTAVALRGHEAALAPGRVGVPGAALPRSVVLHPAQAPSAVATENALMARSLMAPLYIHDSAASRVARLSNMLRDAPRFGAAVNLLA